jgi:hypothetical protein
VTNYERIKAALTIEDIACQYNREYGCPDKKFGFIKTDKRCYAADAEDYGFIQDNSYSCIKCWKNYLNSESES